jgi:hypothetical protein
LGRRNSTAGLLIFRQAPKIFQRRVVPMAGRYPTVDCRTPRTRFLLNYAHTDSRAQPRFLYSEALPRFGQRLFRA